MLLLFFIVQSPPATPGYVNASVVIGNIWPPLNANGPADAVFWTETEMYEWFNESSRRLSGCAGVFVVRDTSLTSALGTATYTLSDAHQATLQADLAGSVLRPRTVQELEALDAAWQSTAGPPVAFLLDVEGVKKLTLYPTPDAASASKAIGLIMRSLPNDVSSSSGFLLSVPAAMAEYFTFSILAEARAKETQAQMPEISQWLHGLTGMMEQAIQGYLGGA